MFENVVETSSVKIFSDYYHTNLKKESLKEECQEKKCKKLFYVK